MTSSSSSYETACFVLAWCKAASVAEVARMMGLSIGGVLDISRVCRESGVLLKEMPDEPQGN